MSKEKLWLFDIPEDKIPTCYRIWCPVCNKPYMVRKVKGEELKETAKKRAKTPTCDHCKHPVKYTLTNGEVKTNG